MEIRIRDVNLQCESDGQLTIGGYINVTERESETLYSRKDAKWFKETMKKGVFDRAIRGKKGEIPLLLEHDWDKRLATTSNSSLELSEDNIGLRFKASLVNQEVYNQVKSGEINACSFGFKVLHQNIEGINERFERRFVDEIELWEVSLVKNPAYVGSLVETRAMLEKEIEAVDSLIEKNSEDVSASDEVIEERAESSKTADEKEDKEVKEEAKNEDSKKEKSTKEDSKELEDKEENSKKSSKELSENSENSEKDEEEKQEKDEERSFDEAPVMEAAQVENDSLSRHEVEKIVADLIQQKMDEITRAEEEEKVIDMELESAKDFHSEIEKEIESEGIRKNLEVMKLRIDLMKLQKLKRGI